jgi:nucleoside-diphosphate-sugar epimerase
MTGSIDEPDGMARNATPSTPYGAQMGHSSICAHVHAAVWDADFDSAHDDDLTARDRRATSSSPSIIEALQQDQTAELGSEWRLVDWVYIDDVVEAFVRTASYTAFNGRSTWQRQAGQHSRLRFADRQTHGPLASAGLRY